MTPNTAAIDAERSLLGAVLSSPAIFAAVTLESRDFAMQTNRAVFGAMQRCAADGRSLDPVTLKGDLEKHGELRLAGGLEYIGTLLDGFPRVGPEAIESWQELIRDRSRKASVLAAAERMQALARSDASAAEVLDGALEALQATAARVGAAVPLNAGEAIREALTAFERTGEDAAGWRTGLPALDSRLGRLQPGWLVIVGARTGLGKTTLLGNLGDAIAAQGGPVLMFSAEMTAREVNQRRLLAEARVPASHFEVGGITPTSRDWDALNMAASTLVGRPFHVVAGTPTPIEARAMARQVQAREGLAAVLFDYLQLFPAGAGRRGETREAEVARVSRALKRLAVDLGVVVIAASQINRAPEAQGKPRAPRLSDLRESGAQEQDCDVAILLHRDEAKADDDVTEAIIAKHRHRAPGRARLRFDGSIHRFADEYEA